MKWSQRLVLLVLSFGPVCHVKKQPSATPSLNLFFLCLPHFPPLPSLSSIPTSPFQPFFCSDFDFSLAQSSPGSELETVEGPPDVPRLLRDEDPTRGSLVQQEKAIVDGPGEEQNRKPPEEVVGQLALKPQQPTKPAKQARYGCFCATSTGLNVSQLLDNMLHVLGKKKERGKAHTQE